MYINIMYVHIYIYIMYVSIYIYTSRELQNLVMLFQQDHPMFIPESSPEFFCSGNSFVSYINPEFFADL